MKKLTQCKILNAYGTLKKAFKALMEKCTCESWNIDFKNIIFYLFCSIDLECDGGYNLRIIILLSEKTYYISHIFTNRKCTYMNGGFKLKRFIRKYTNWKLSNLNEVKNDDIPIVLDSYQVYQVMFQCLCVRMSAGCLYFTLFVTTLNACYKYP